MAKWTNQSQALSFCQTVKLKKNTLEWQTEAWHSLCTSLCVCMCVCVSIWGQRWVCPHFGAQLTKQTISPGSRIDHVPVKRKRKVTRGRVSIYSTWEELHAVNKNIWSYCVNLTEKKQKLEHKSHYLIIKWCNYLSIPPISPHTHGFVELDHMLVSNRHVVQVILG